MARVIVVGGGMAGLAAAARLGKLGHSVTLCERSPVLGGDVRATRKDGLTWDLGPATTTLPAALRDLFRKSGRPLERVLELIPVTTPRRHVFDDGLVVDLPLTSRSDQRDVLSTAFDAATADAWTSLVDAQVPAWDLLRKHALEYPYRGASSLGLGGLRLLRPWRSFASVAARTLPDPRAGSLLAATALGMSADPSSAPGFLTVLAYVERTFGRWTCDGGLTPLVDALAARLAERGVSVRPGTTVASLVSSPTGVTGVRLDTDEVLPADVVVCSVPVAPLLGTSGRWARSVQRLSFASPVRQINLSLDTPSPEDAPFETVFHGRSAALRSAPGSRSAVFMSYDRERLSGGSWGRSPRGDGRKQPMRSSASDVGVPVESDPGDLEDLGDLGKYLGGMGIAERFEVEVPQTRPVWDGARMFGRLAPTRTPLHGLFCVGPTAQPGPGLPCELLGAALAATEIGKA